MTVAIVQDVPVRQSQRLLAKRVSAANIKRSFGTDITHNENKEVNRKRKRCEIDEEGDQIMYNPKKRSRQANSKDSKQNTVQEKQNVGARSKQTIKKLEILPYYDLVLKNDDLQSIEYTDDIVQSLRRSEQLLKDSIKKDYMGKQQFLISESISNGAMRSILLNWFIKKHNESKMQLCTLYLAVNMMDRYLNIKLVHRTHLKLIICVCLWIASKIHEIYPAYDIADYVDISEDAFDEEDMINYESKIVNALDFQLTIATPLSFAERYIRIVTFNKSQAQSIVFIHLYQYFLELLLLEYSIVEELPSKMAAAAIAYVIITCKMKKLRNRDFQILTGYQFKELIHMVRLLHLAVNTKKDITNTVFAKYSDPKFSRVALLNYADVCILDFC